MELVSCSGSINKGAIGVTFTVARVVPGLGPPRSESSVEPAMWRTERCALDVTTKLTSVCWNVIFQL